MFLADVIVENFLPPFRGNSVFAATAVVAKHLRTSHQAALRTGMRHVRFREKSKLKIYVQGENTIHNIIVLQHVVK